MTGSRGDDRGHEQVRMIISTVSSEEDATRLSRLWVEDHRAACVTRLPGARSVYAWEGEIQDDGEILLLIKTSVRNETHLADLLASFAADHPYDQPELLVFSPAGGATGYLAWVLGWCGEAHKPPEGGA